MLERKNERARSKVDESGRSKVAKVDWHSKTGRSWIIMDVLWNVQFSVLYKFDFQLFAPSSFIIVHFDPRFGR